MIQTQSRTRTCNTAQNGGSTSVCTNTRSHTIRLTTRYCNTNGCREFPPHFIKVLGTFNIPLCPKISMTISLLKKIFDLWIFTAVAAYWYSWGSWGSCSKSCGSGVSTLKIDWFQNTLNSTIFSVKNSSPVIIQTQSRTRGCRTALNGGSTSVCTSTESATRSCNTNGCREFHPYLTKVVGTFNLLLCPRLLMMNSFLWSIFISAVAAYWLNWGAWGSCSKTCGSGVSTLE